MVMSSLGDDESELGALTVRVSDLGSYAGTGWAGVRFQDPTLVAPSTPRHGVSAILYETAQRKLTTLNLPRLS